MNNKDSKSQSTAKQGLCASGEHKLDREERLRLIKERQNEERLRKLEELKQQAEAAQKFKEKAEEERRKRIEELKNRDQDRMRQAEIRRKLLSQAEREKHEAIVKKNQEREAKLEMKKKEKNANVFAFGSSLPRMLDPIDSSVYWNNRRAASTMNVMSSSVHAGIPSVMTTSLTRRSSDRDVTESTSNLVKKRATSAEVDRKHNMTLSLAPGSTIHLLGDGSERNAKSCTNGVTNAGAAARKRTDLIPISRPLRSSGKQNSTSMTHLAVSHRLADLSKSTTHLARSVSSKTTRQIASRSAQRSGDTTPTTPSSTTSRPFSVAQPRAARQTAASSHIRPASAPATQRRPRPLSIAVTGVSSAEARKRELSSEKKVITKPIVRKTDDNKPKAHKGNASLKSATTPVPTPTVDIITTPADTPTEEHHITNISTGSVTPPSGSVNDLAECDMQSSMTSSMTRSQIVTEEQAKAALAERRRLVREQAERDAEAERQRLEAERLAEEEEQKRLEEEQIRLLEEAKKAEELRLQAAIKEKEKREIEEQKQKEEELRLRLEKEERDRKEKEEAERLRKENEIRLKKEEEERQARRLRVEAIMKRTRNKSQQSSPATKDIEGEEAQPTKRENGKSSGGDGEGEDESFNSYEQEDSVPPPPPPSLLIKTTSYESTNGISKNGNNNNDNNFNGTQIDFSEFEIFAAGGAKLTNENGRCSTAAQLLDLDFSQTNATDTATLNSQRQTSPNMNDLLL